MNTSTILLAFCALAVTSVLGEDMKEMVHAKAQKCIQQTGVDADVFKKATDEANVDDKVKCFEACFLKELGLMAEDGSVDTAVAKAAVPSDVPNREKIVAAIDACGNEKGANECDTAHAIRMCIHKQHMDIMS